MECSSPGTRSGWRTWTACTPSTGGAGLTEVGSSAGGDFDGVGIVDGRVLLASQADSSLRVLSEGGSRIVIRVPGRPADIGVDTRRRRVAVPYIALDRVDVWRLPSAGPDS